MKTGLNLFAFALSFVASVAVAQATWQDDLSYEIALVYDCEIAFLSHVVERDVGEKQVVMAKVHCTDQRSFDAQRLDPLEPFHFSPCEHREKTTC